MISHPSPLHVDVSALGAVAVLSVDGVLDSTTYRPLRDSITKSALDLPVAVIVDVSSLRIPAASACAVFSSARWQVSRWPDVPVLLACSDPALRELLVQNGIGRYVPIHPDVDTAADSVGIHARERIRRRARVELLRSRRSVDEAKAFVAECLAEWSLKDQITAAKMVVTELVRNALTHTDSAPSLLVESRGALVTIAVEDGSTRPATLPETTFSRPVTGLELVAGLSRAWGTVPSSTGKTVWATIEPQ
jgi:hypothetical protein